MRYIKNWLDKQRKINAWPIDTPYTFVYNLPELPLPQPWRENYRNKAYFVPSEFLLRFTDRGRMSVLRVKEREELALLEQDMLQYGIKTPVELRLDPKGTLRLQEGHHRMCVIEANISRFPRTPTTIVRTDLPIRAYGRSVYEEFPYILQAMERAKLYEEEDC
jgi:hypothetical protein